jgi:CDP-diacylglycerol---glycerol-3-phosphate 3-phosphatidyltransferase
MRRPLLNIAMVLTVARIFMSPVFLLIYLYYQQMGIPLIALPWLLIGLLSLTELSDLFDGFLARKRNQVTDLGKVLDPMADSIFRLSVLLTFTQGIIQLPILLVCVFIYRDSIISTLRTVCAMRGVTLAARLSGKIKAVIQAATSFGILILMVPYSLGVLSLESLREISFYSVLVAAAYTVFSGLEYIVANFSILKRALLKEDAPDTRRDTAAPTVSSYNQP